MAKRTKKSKVDNYQIITDKILAALEGKKIPWIKPWKNTNNPQAGSPYNGATGHVYKGMNIILCWMTPFTDDRWMSYKQMVALGGNLKEEFQCKGSGTQITYWNFIKEKDDDGELTGKVFPLLKTFTVFNVQQMENLDESKLVQPEQIHVQPNNIIEFIENAGIRVEHGGNKACYVPSNDRVHLPVPQNFKNEHEYNATALHEAGHATGHKSRLDRPLNEGRFGNKAYAFEELVAEMTSAFMCNFLNVENDSLQHVGYIQSWIEILENDKYAFVKAAGLAQRACEYLFNAQEEAKQAA